MPTSTTTPSTTPTSGSLAQNLQAISGNWVEIYFGTQKIGYLSDFSAQDDFGLQPLGGIGDAHYQEYVPGAYSNTITASRAILRKESIFGLMNAQASGAGGTGSGTTATPPFGNIDGALQGFVFDIVVRQKGQQNTNIRFYRRCSFASFSLTIQQHTIVMSNVTLHALDADSSADGSGTGWQGLTDMDQSSNQ